MARPIVDEKKFEEICGRVHDGRYTKSQIDRVNALYIKFKRYNSICDGDALERAEIVMIAETERDQGMQGAEEYDEIMRIQDVRGT